MKFLSTAALCLLLAASAAAEDVYVFEAGHPSLKSWLLPEQPPHPQGNAPTAERIELGRKLFFDPRLSGDGNMSCATCHNPSFGWSDGLPTAKGFQSMVLGRATPTIINTGYNTIQMWDGRKATLEDQALGPMESNVEMNVDVDEVVVWLQQDAAYQRLFAAAYQDEPISKDTLAKAIAAFERTVVSTNSRFDQWVRGDAGALTEREVAGFRVFVGEGQCVACHSGANFTDNGFHNLGLASWGAENPDMGRYSEKPIGILKGAFKTPTVRDIERTPPYFHDGSAQTLMDVVDHYVVGGVVRTNLSPSFKPVDLDDQQKADLVAFMLSLTSPYQAPSLPDLAVQ